MTEATNGEEKIKVQSYSGATVDLDLLQVSLLSSQDIEQKQGEIFN